jgi:hypothetical protein
LKGLTKASLDNLPLTATLGAALALSAALVATGCGTGNEATSAPHDSQAPHVDGERAASKPASKADPSRVRGIGQAACAGMTPIEAAAHFEGPARRAGVEKKFAKYVAEPPTSIVNSPGYPRLVAAIYASTLPVKQRAEAAAGCAESLALSSSGGQGSSKRAMQEGPSSSGGQVQKGSNSR